MSRLAKMKKTTKKIKKTLGVLMLLAFALGPINLSSNIVSVAHAAVLPNWNVTGTYSTNIIYQSTTYNHAMNLSQDSSGNLTGDFGFPDGTNVFTWAITSGTVSGNTIDFTTNFVATADATTAMHMVGTIAPNGTISGTWSDNHNNVNRTGTFSTQSGAAIPLGSLGSLAAEDFGVMNMSGVKGYTAGFGLTNATFAGATSVVVKLNSGNTLLQTDTLSGPNAASITGTQISSPFDVFGTFNYVTDGFWTNVRGSEFGQTLIPTSVTATVTLADGRIVTATNTNLTGDPATIFPVSTNANVATNPATAITPANATLNGTNLGNAATGHSFWVSLSPFVTTSSTIPANVFSTGDLGAIAMNTAFSAPLTSVVGMPAITPNTTYYFVAWVNVGGTWFPGQLLNFTTGPTTPGVIDGTIGGTVTGGLTDGILAVTSVDTVNSTAIADGTFANGWKYIFNITIPTTEHNLAMKFTNWTLDGGSSTISVANNIRISSAQANNSGATVLITAPGTYSTPALDMTGDLNPALAGMQVKVMVETAIPLNSINGAYTTNYGVKTQ